MALSHFTDQHSIECRLGNLPKARGEFVSELQRLKQLCCSRKKSGLGVCVVVNFNLLFQSYPHFVQLKNCLCILQMSPKEHFTMEERGAI